MKNIYGIVFLMMLTVGDWQVAFSQTAPAIEWQNTIGGSDIDMLWSVLQTSDGGYLLGGSSFSNISGDKVENNMNIGIGISEDYWIVKIDQQGSIQWQNTIGGSSSDQLYSMQQTIDGGYILGGFSLSNISGDKTENSMGYSDYWVIKINALGALQWQNTIGGNNEDYLYSIKQTSDGGYLLGGNSRSNTSGDKTENSEGQEDFWVIKLDTTGNIQWQNTIGGSSSDLLKSISQTSDGGYILGGYSNSNISGDKTENNIGGNTGDTDYWIVKLNASGSITWQNTIGGIDNDLGGHIKQTLDGGYIIGGASNSNISGDKAENSNGGYDYWIVKTDSSGNIQWQNTIGGNFDDFLALMQQSSDGGYIISGGSLSNISGDKTENCIGGYDYWTIKLNVFGNVSWQKTIGGNSNDYLQCIQQTADDGYILGGYSISNISGVKTENSNGLDDYWVVKLAPDTITGIPNLQSSTFNFQFSPNPLITYSTLTFSNPRNEKFVFTLYDITGRLCAASPLERGKGCVITTDNKIILEKGNKQAGVYLFRLQNVSTAVVINGKIIVQ